MKKISTTALAYSIGALLLIGVGAWMVWGGGSDAPKVYSAGTLSAAETAFDLGTISMGNGTVAHQYTVTNDSKETVTIEKVYTSCMCTSASITVASGKSYGVFGMPGHEGSSRTSIPVGPGEAIRVEAVFDPAAHGPSGVGLAQRSVYLETNSSASPKMELSFQALVTR